MAIFQPEDRTRIKRVKAEQAVSLAMQSRWAEAAELNQQIIEAYPKDVEAHNRLGKSLIELGKFDEAREAYNHALRLDPANRIAQKNLNRLDKLMEEQVAAEVPTGPVDPSLFIAETGRATTTSLVELAAVDVLAKMNPGDTVRLEVQARTVLAINAYDELLGKIEPKLRQRLIRLIGMGNEYAAIVTAVDESSLRLIIRETHRDPSMGNRPSFPVAGEAFRGSVREGLLRYEEEEEEEEEGVEGVEAEPVDVVAEDVAVEEAAPELAEDDEDEES